VTLRFPYTAVNAVRIGLLGLSALLPIAPAGNAVGAPSTSDAPAERPAVFPRTGFVDGSINLRGWVFSPDGRHLLTADDASLRVWDTSTWRELRSLQGHQRKIREVALSRDGRIAATASDDGTVRLWDWLPGKSLRTINFPVETPGPPAFGISSVSLSPDGRLVAASAEAGLAVWSTRDGKLVLHVTLNSKAMADLGVHTVETVRFLDSETLVLHGVGGIVVGSLATRKVQRTLLRKVGTVSTFTVSPDGRWLLVGDTDDNVHVLDIGSGETRLRLKANAAALAGNLLVTCHDKTVRITAIADGTSQTHAARCGHSVIAGAPGKHALINIGQEQLTTIDLDTGNAREVRLAYAFAAPSLAALGQEEMFLAAGDADAVVRGWGLRSGKELVTSGGPGTFQLVAVSQDDLMLAIAAMPPFFNPDPSRFGYGVRLIDLKTGAFRLIPESPVKGLALSEDGGRLMTYLSTIKVWDTRTGRLIREFGEPKHVTAAAISPDGSTIAAVGVAGEYLWRVSDGKLIWRSEARTTLETYDQTFSVTFTPDGRSALFGSMRGPIYLHDAASGRRLDTLSGHGSLIGALTISRDGRAIASASWDGTVRIWNASNRQVTATIAVPGPHIRHLAFTGDGSRLLAAVSDGTIRLWEVKPGRELATFISLFDGGWIVITPEGYFNGSQRAPDHINVRVGDRLASLNQFYDAFYRPDLVERKLRGEDISRLISQTLDEALKNPPPRAEFIGNADLNADRASVRFRITSTGGGIGDIQIFHNGKLVRSDPPPSALPPESRITLAALTPDALTRRLTRAAAATRDRPRRSSQRPASIEDSLSVEAIPGENLITVAAFNRTDAVMSEPATIRFVGPSKNVAPVVHVLAVGIDEYRERPLKYAVKDATDFANALQAAAGSARGKSEIRLVPLVNGAASRQGIVAELKRIAAVAKPWDSVIVFVASHGMLLDHGYAIVTHDFDGTLPKGLIGADELLEFSKAIPALNQLIVLDTCHAGGLNSLVRGLLDARMAVFARNSGMHIFASAAESQEAIDGYQGNGLFTHALLNAIRNPTTDRNQDKLVSIVELGQAARRATIQIGRKIRFRQTPAIFSFGMDTTLYRLP